MPYADLVFTGGPVFTANSVRSRASAVAVRDGRIVAVGTDDDVRELIGPSTEVVDLAGRMLLPGFQDAHVHPVWGGLDLMRCDLAPFGTERRVPRAHRRIRARARRRRMGARWRMADVRLPRRHPDGGVARPGRARPAGVPAEPRRARRVGQLGGAARSPASTADTPDPADGRIERDADGNPTGTLHEGAMSLVNRHLPETSLETLTEALLLGQQYLHSYGVTAWQDAIVGSYGDAGDPGPAYLAAAASGKLTARVVGALWWDRTAGLEQIDSLVERA